MAHGQPAAVAVGPGAVVDGVVGVQLDEKTLAPWSVAEGLLAIDAWLRHFHDAATVLF